MEFEQSIFAKLYAYAFQSGIADFIIIFLGRYLPYIIVVSIIVFLLQERNWKIRAYNISLALLALVLSRGLITELIQFFYHRARPPVVLSIEPLFAAIDSASFPSEHMAVLFALSMVIYLLHRGWGVLFLGLGVLVGFARITAGVHWPLDILAGIAIGIFSAILVKKLLPRSQALS